MATPCAETEPPLPEKLSDHLAACHFSSDA